MVTLQVEMELLKRRLEEESRARATADSRILEVRCACYVYNTGFVPEMAHLYPAAVLLLPLYGMQVHQKLLSYLQDFVELS